MIKEELGKLYPITVVTYYKNWTSIFENEKETIVNILGSEIALRVDHIGRTAVPNLSGKPTIDILVEIPKEGIKDLIIGKQQE